MALVGVFMDEPKSCMEVVSFWEDHWIQSNFDHFVGMELVFRFKRKTKSFSLLIHGHLPNPCDSEYFQKIWSSKIKNNVINLASTYALNGKEIEVEYEEKGGISPRSAGNVSIGSYKQLTILDEGSVNFQTDSTTYSDLTKIEITKENGSFEPNKLYIMRIAFLLSTSCLPNPVKKVVSIFSSSCKQEIHILTFNELKKETISKLRNCTRFVPVWCERPTSERTCSCQAFVYFPNKWKFESLGIPVISREDIPIRKRNYPYTSKPFKKNKWYCGKRLDYSPRAEMVFKALREQKVSLRGLIKGGGRSCVRTLPTSPNINPIYYKIVKRYPAKYFGILGFSVGLATAMTYFLSLDIIMFLLLFIFLSLVLIIVSRP